MEDAALASLRQWDNFYVIIGSSAAALTGLQFVVMALLEGPRPSRSPLAIRAFGTPNVLNFSAALLIAAIMTMPWPSLAGPDWAVGICGVGGVVYEIRIFRLVRRQSGYTPDLEDWFWYACLPLLAHVTLLAAALLLAWRTVPSLFVIAASTLLLIFTGIHNAWDSITHLTVESWRQGEQPPDPT